MMLQQQIEEMRREMQSLKSQQVVTPVVLVAAETTQKQDAGVEEEDQQEQQPKKKRAKKADAKTFKSEDGMDVFLAEVAVQVLPVVEALQSSDDIAQWQQDYSPDAMNKLKTKIQSYKSAAEANKAPARVLNLVNALILVAFTKRIGFVFVVFVFFAVQQQNDCN